MAVPPFVIYYRSGQIKNVFCNLTVPFVVNISCPLYSLDIYVPYCSIFTFLRCLLMDLIHLLSSHFMCVNERTMILLTKNLDVVFIQEGHLTKQNKLLYEAEWGNKWYGTTGSGSKLGTAILINPKCKINVKRCFIDKQGRYVICLIEHEDKMITMCNLYAPNIDDPVFFEHVFKATNEFPTENIIIGGDFNLTLNTDIDRLNSSVNNHKSAKFILQFIEDND